jgi:hypothetical protein
MLAEVSQPKRQEWNYFLWAIPSDVGFASVMLSNRKCLPLGNFYQQNCDRYFGCDYTNSDVLQDIGVGCWHDGTMGRTSKSAEVIDMKFVEDLSRWTSTRRLGRTG